MNNYLITLTPLGKYFFGGDMTFQVENNKTHNDEFASYIIKSNKFPQQTSLLGMMRYLLLTKSTEVFSKEMDRILNPCAANDLIGKNSFMVNENHDCNRFGKIESLSPCFLMKDNTVYLPVPKDFGLNPIFGKTAWTCTYNGYPVTVPEMASYNPKEYKEQLYINTETGETVKEGDIFHEDTRIGIRKSHDGRSGDKGFYKQISYRMAKGFCFSFTVQADVDLSGCSSEIVSLGGDGSKFLLKAARIQNNMPMPDYSILAQPKVVLLSDSFITMTDMEKSIFHISDTKPFRFIKSTTSTKNYTIMSGDAKRSAKFHLYGKGSVFYFNNEDDADEFITKLKEKKEFIQIGYNIATKINK